LCSDRCTNPVASGYRSDRQFAANGGNRVSQVALCAPNFPAQCNRRELQVSGVLRIFLTLTEVCCRSDKKQSFSMP